MAVTDAPTQPEPAAGPQTSGGQDPASSAEGGSVAAPSTGQAPDGAPSGTDAGNEGNGQIDPAELQRRLESAERAAQTAKEDAAKYRRQLREREAAERQAAAETQTDEDRQKQEREEFEQERTQFRLERAMARIGPALNLVDPDAALWLLDWNEIDFDADGTPTNLRELTEALIEARKDPVTGKSWLVRDTAPTTPTPPPAAPTIGASTGAAAAGPAPTLTAQELEYIKSTPGMTPERYAALKGVKTLQDYQKITPGPQQ